MFFKRNKKAKSEESPNQSPAKLINAAPINYQEARLIAKELIAGNVIVLDVSKCSKSDGMRIVDLLSGVLLTTRGDYKRIAPMTFLLVPKKAMLEKYYNILTNRDE